MLPINLIESHIVNTLLSPEAIRQYAAGDVAQRELSPFVGAIQAISKSYVAHKVGSNLNSPISSDLASKAYALYYTPINAAKVLSIGQKLAPSGDKVRVLDLGSGPGTAGLALLSTLPGEIELTCVETSAEMAATAKLLLNSFKGRSTLTNLHFITNLNQSNARDFDIIIAANVLAEMKEVVAVSAIHQLIESLAKNGQLVLIEPGQQLHTRRLMKIRDLVLDSYPHLVPIFPCFRNTPCPMLTHSATDWCHNTLEWRQPKLSRQLDGLLSFNKHRIKYAGFIFQKNGTLGRGVRVLTPPTKSRIGTECLICGASEYGIARIPKGRRRPGTRALEKAGVFDHLVFSEEFSGDAPAEVEISRQEILANEFS